MTIKNRQEGSSVIEYLALGMFILSALFVSRTYILNGIMGQWKKLGDTFGHEKQFDPRMHGPEGASGGTEECFYDNTHCQSGAWDTDTLGCDDDKKIDAWINQRCYDAFCDCTIPPENTTEYIGSDDAALPGGCLECLEYCSGIGECNR